MKQFCSEELKKQIVTAIKDGLSITRDDYRANGRLKYSMNFRKVENVGNSVIKMMETNYEGIFRIPVLMRGNFPVFMMYHNDSNTLIGVMSRGCRERILRKRGVNPHYLNALVDFNAKHNLQPLGEQMSLGDMMNYDQKQLEPIKIKVKDQIDGIEPEYYFTILFDMDGLNLTGVEMVLMSESMTVSFSDDWSEYIEIDYHNNYDVQEDITDSYDMLDISVKDDKINDEDSVEVDVRVAEREKEK